MAPRRAHRGSPISAAGADMEPLGAQVRARGDDRTSVFGLGAQESHGGAHG